MIPADDADERPTFEAITIERGTPISIPLCVGKRGLSPVLDGTLGMRISDLRLPVIEHSASRLSLYPHQIAMWEGWEKCPAMLLAAKTGTGKTLAAMLPVLRRREWAVAVYPTNELLRDQVRAVAQLARDGGSEPLVWTPEVWAAPDRAERYATANHILVPVDGALLDQWQKVMRCKSRGETIRRLLDPDKPKIVFTNPTSFSSFSGSTITPSPSRRYAVTRRSSWMSSTSIRE